jgi:hypothetical protein
VALVAVKAARHLQLDVVAALPPVLSPSIQRYCYDTIAAIHSTAAAC